MKNMHVCGLQLCVNFIDAIIQSALIFLFFFKSSIIMNERSVYDQFKAIISNVLFF